MKKTILSIKNIAFAAGIVMLFVACKKDANPKALENTEKKSIAELVKMSPQHSFLYAAVVKAGLASTLSGEGTFTVFAPTDDAFKAAGFPDVKSVQDAPSDVLKGILLYHVLGTVVKSADVQGTSALPVKTLADKDFYVSGKDGKVWVNNAMVTAKDLVAKNGVVHVIDNVLLPPSKNLVELAQSNPDLSTLVAAVVQLGEPTITLSTGGPFTVLAPTNQAFNTLLEDFNFANLAAVPDGVLATILTYHLVESRVFSYNLTEGLMPATVQGEKVTFTLTGGAKVKGISNATPSNIVAVDILGTNGVVHAIDQVLVPTL